MNTIRRIPAPLAATAALLLAASGCGTDNGLTLARVSGTVTYDGKPVTNGTVFFKPDESRGTVGPAALASLRDDGAYTLSTEHPGDGVIVGTHKVGVTGIEYLDGDDAAAPPIDPSRDAAGFMKAKAQAARPTRARARAASDADVHTDKGGRKFRYVVPMKFADAEKSGIVVKIDGSRTVDIDIDENGDVKTSP